MFHEEFSNPKSLYTPNGQIIKKNFTITSKHITQA